MSEKNETNAAAQVGYHKDLSEIEKKKTIVAMFQRSKAMKS